MMKFALLSLSPNANYGGLLQLWALQQVVNKLGYESEILIRKKQAKIPISIYFKRIILKLLGKSDTPIFKEQIIGRNERRLFKFIDEHYNSRVVKSLEDINKDEYDGIIVGSDQVWRKPYFLNSWNTVNYYDAFLDFAKNWNIKRIAYAASFGISDLQFDREENKEIQSLLSKFNYISAREVSGVKIIEREFNLSSDLVLDPTLLLSRNEYEVLCRRNKVNVKQQNIVVTYILDKNPETESIIEKVLESKRLRWKELYNSDEMTPYISVIDWVNTIASAELVITDSYHGCIFSLIFNKPLIFTGNNKRGNARFETLIEMFDLNQNYISDNTQYNPDFDYILPKNTADKIKKLQDESIALLRKSLSY